MLRTCVPPNSATQKDCSASPILGRCGVCTALARFRPHACRGRGREELMDKATYPLEEVRERLIIQHCGADARLAERADAQVLCTAAHVTMGTRSDAQQVS